MAPATATPDSKKRGRPRNDESDLDELSAKKPRLTTTSSTTSTTSINNKRTTPSSLRSLSSAISGVFGFGASKVSTNGVLKKGRSYTDKAREVPDSGDKEGDGKKERIQLRKIQARTAAVESPVKKSLGNLDGIYDFPDPDEEPSPAQMPRRRSRGPASTTSRASATPRSTSTAARRVSKPHSQSPGLKRGGRGASAKKNNGQDKQAGEGEGHDHDHDTPQVSSSEDELTPAPVRSINKLRGTTRADTNGSTPKLKGILTPSRRLSERNPKSVAFDEKESRADEVYFADLPSKTNKHKAPPPLDKQNSQYAGNTETQDAEEKQDEEEDDEVCVICLKPDSKPPNEILFCDSCDMAVHQKCYGVARIPQGDWLCKGCSQESSSGAGTLEKKATVVAENVPSIPNLEQHLRALQRVLIDRCTGRRRIRLRDQDEAYDKTFQLVEQTVLAGEGNSMLVIGARGCGKTTVSSAYS